MHCTVKWETVQGTHLPRFLSYLKHSVQILDHHHPDHLPKLLTQILILLSFLCHVKMTRFLYVGPQGYLKPKDINKF